MRIIFLSILLFTCLSLAAQSVIEVNRGTGPPSFTPCGNCAWFYLDESTGTFYIWDGTSLWNAVGTGGGGSVSNPLTSDLDLNSYSLADGDNDEIYFLNNAWNIKGDSLIIRKPTAFSAAEEFNIWFPSTVTPIFAGIGIYSQDGGGISRMRFYTSKISGTYVPSLNMEISKDQVAYYVPAEFQAGAYSFRATTGASSYFTTSKTAYSTMDLGSIASGGNAGVSGLRFGAIQAGSNNYARSAIFAEYNNAFGSNLVFVVGRRGDFSYGEGEGLRFMEVTETSATSGVARISFPAASEVIFGGAIKDKDSQTGSNGQVLGSTGTSNDWKNVGDLPLTNPTGGTATVQNSVNDVYTRAIQRLVEINTAGSGAPNVLTSSESDKVLTNEGSTAQNYHTLPTAAAGLTFTFVVQDGDGIRIVANTGDTIRVAGTVSASAGYTESTTVGDVITLIAINATEWIAISYIGTWTTI